MKEPRFTPGPWRAGLSIYKSQARVVADKGGRIADVFAYEEEQAKANAALITAAPELHRDLREAVVENCGGRECPHWDYEKFTCSAEPGTCFVQRWIETLKKAEG